MFFKSVPFMQSAAEILISSRNLHKIGEIKSILGASFHWLSLNDFPDAPEVVEDAPTIAGNATKKAVELARWIAGTQSGNSRSNLSVLADDSGLEVDALNGAPGVHSARFANPTEAKNAPDRANIEKLPVLRVSEKHRSPVCNADEFELATQIAEGVCEGRIGFEPKGQGGFGYDPLFVPEGFSETFAELSEEVKNGLSHRGRALAALKGKH
jgi:XTP/dITP diphosphohydrolase